jgi:hypothetical protein
MTLLQRQLAVSKARRRRISLHDLVTGHAPASWLSVSQLPDGRPSYADTFFADPAAVEDDYRRMRRD